VFEALGLNPVDAQSVEEAVTVGNETTDPLCEHALWKRQSLGPLRRFAEPSPIGEVDEVLRELRRSSEHQHELIVNPKPTIVALSLKIDPKLVPSLAVWI
jgi:hypothetical protein